MSLILADCQFLQLTQIPPLVVPPFQASKSSSSLPLPPVSLSFPPAVSGFFLCWQLEGACCFQGAPGIVLGPPGWSDYCPSLTSGATNDRTVREEASTRRSLSTGLVRQVFGTCHSLPHLSSHNTLWNTRQTSQCHLQAKLALPREDDSQPRRRAGLLVTSLTSALRACFIVCTGCNCWGKIAFGVL